MIPVFIISLPDATDRRERLTGLLNDIGLPFEFFDAVDLRGQDIKTHENYNRLKRLSFLGRDLTGGELGCTLSHKKLYEKMIDENIDQALILEDDVMLKDGFMAALSALQNSDVLFDMIRFLGSPKLERLKLRPIVNITEQHVLTRHTGMPGGSHASLVTLSGAKKMAKVLQNTPYAIDALMGRSWETGLNWYTVRPGLASQDLSFESMIGNDDRFDNRKDVQGIRKLLYPVTRAWFKLSETIGKKYWHYSKYFKDKSYGR